MMSTLCLVFVAALVSAFVPALPAEGSLIGTVTVTHQHVLPLAVAAGAGQTLGKALMLLGVRGTLRSEALCRWLERRSGAAPAEPDGAGEAARRRRRLPGLATVRRWNRALLAALDRPTLAVPIVALSAVAGVPPLLLTVLVIAHTRMSIGVFALTCLVGRIVRFAAVGYLPELTHLGLSQ